MPFSVHDSNVQMFVLGAQFDHRLQSLDYAVAWSTRVANSFGRLKVELSTKSRAMRR